MRKNKPIIKREEIKRFENMSYESILCLFMSVPFVHIEYGRLISIVAIIITSIFFNKIELIKKYIEIISTSYQKRKPLKFISYAFLILI